MRKKIATGLLAALIGIQGLFSAAAGELPDFEDTLSDGSEFEAEEIILLEEDDSAEEISDDPVLLSFDDTGDSAEAVPEGNGSAEQLLEDGFSLEDGTGDIPEAGAPDIADSGSCGSNVTYVLYEDGLLTIRGNGRMRDYSTSYNRHPWEDEENVRRIIIESGVTSIGEYAFKNFGNLESVSIPDSVESIGLRAFENCSSLTDITLPGGLTEIGASAFQNCSSLSGISIPDNVSVIDEAVFFGCRGLTEVWIPDGVTEIGDMAFYNCSSLQSVPIPDSVSEIGSMTFSGCSSLTNVTIPNGVKRIGERVFTNCVNLKNVTIPDSVLSIGSYAFYNCSKLTGVTIPDSVTSIDSYAFALCTRLEKMIFLVRDTSVGMTFGSDLLRSSKPVIYCYRSTTPAGFFTNNGGYTVVYLDNVSDLDNIRSISLPEDFRMACGDKVKLIYTVFPADDTPIVWTSSDPSVISVENGTVTAVNPGTAVITAETGTVSDTMTVTAYLSASALVLNKTEFWLEAGLPLQLSVISFIPENATAESITWTSSDISCADVDDNGYVTTVQPGDVTITAATEKGASADCVLHLTDPVLSVSLDPASVLMGVGDTAQLTAEAATGSGSYVNKHFDFISSDESIATVNPDGLVKALSPGTVTITAAVPGGHSAETEITVQTDRILQQPKLIAAYNGAKGIGIKFIKPDNAAEYTIFRKFNGIWEQVCTVSADDPGLQIDGNRVMYTDTSVASNYGKGYIYSVAAGNGALVTSYDLKGSAIYRLTPPTLTKITNPAAGTAEVTWKGVFGRTETNGNYDLQYAEYKDGKAGEFRSVTTLPGYDNLTLKASVPDLQKGSRYVFRIRCSKTNKDRGTYYSEYSRWLSITIEK